MQRIKVTETKIPIFFFVVAIVLSMLTIVDLLTLSYPEYFGYGPSLLAEKLIEKPDKYIPLANPDSYLLQAISNPGKDVFIGSWENTQFDEMVETYGTSNIEFNGIYYEIHLLSVDVFVYGLFFWLLMISWGILGIPIIIKHLRKKRNLSYSSV